MGEQVLIKTIQAMSQEIAQITIDKNLFKVELEQAREEIVKLQQELKDAQKTNEQEVV